LYPHPIRLRGPWEYEPLAGDARPVRIHAPSPVPAFAGRVRLLRRFGYPGTLDADEHVWLRLPPLPPGSTIIVNGTTLEGVAREYDITALLRPRNELRIDLDIGPDSPDWEGAALEVRAAAFLDALEVVRTPGHVGLRGVVCGTVESVLELYLIADRRPLGYATVAPGGETRFELLVPDRHEDGAEVRNLRLDLVRGAVIWYTYEIDPE
jgi:hypothetical protein